MIRKLTLILVATAMAVLGGCSKDCPECPSEGAILQLNKHKINFGSDRSSTTFSISNRGAASLSWDISINPASAAVSNGGWLSASQTSGTGDATVICTADRSRLTEVGVSRATLIINSADAVNTVRDSIEVYILNGSKWVITDNGAYEDCYAAQVDDYYFVKGFRMPQNQEAVIVDSIRINFCEAGDSIYLRGFGVRYVAEQQFNYPGNALYMSPYEYTVTSGWNTFAVNWLFTDSIFYLGYEKAPSKTVPDLSVDRSSTDTNSFVVSWFTEGVTEPGYYWWYDSTIQTFAIQIFETPVLKYYPKLAGLSDDQYEGHDPAIGYARQGQHPISLKPRRAQ